jgi:hypothetical protein
MMPNQAALLNCDRSNCAASARVDSSWQEDNGRQCSNCTRVFPWFSIQHGAWSFEVTESVHMVGARKTEGSRKKWTKWVCPCNISYGMRSKEKICFTELLLGKNHGWITINANQSVLQCNGNITVHLQPKSLRLCHQLGRLCLLCFRILREYC